MNTQWRNKCIDSTYEPGSTFKPITLAIALEEGVVSKSSTFSCSGAVSIEGWTLRCSKKTGHGSQSLVEAVGNSCNPAFINIGLRVGTEKYYEYLQAFGLMEKTGVDMVGEVAGIFTDPDTFNSHQISLASYSFGQTFNVTPLELIRAQAACINGGYLYTPYVVEQELDSDGNVIYQHEATPVRQVISEETSAVVRECLEYVVASGTGKNGQVAGYRIGGKTGTADKTETRNTTKEVVVSFMCFCASGRSPVYHAAHHGHPQPEYRRLCVRRQHGGAYCQQYHGGHSACPGGGAGLQRRRALQRGCRCTQCSGRDCGECQEPLGGSRLFLPHGGKRRHRHGPDSGRRRDCTQ